MNYQSRILKQSHCVIVKRQRPVESISMRSVCVDTDSPEAIAAPILPLPSLSSVHSARLQLSVPSKGPSW